MEFSYLLFGELNELLLLKGINELVALLRSQLE